MTFFDTADNYGQGLSESILGEALRGRRDGIVVATKFGEDPMPDQEDPWSLDTATVARACEASLRRLEVERIDLYLLHRRDYALDQAPALMDVLEGMVRAGKIRYYGWSTDDVERARLFAHGEHCVAIWPSLHGCYAGHRRTGEKRGNCRACLILKAVILHGI